MSRRKLLAWLAALEVEVARIERVVDGLAEVDGILRQTSTSPTAPPVPRPRQHRPRQGLHIVVD